MSAKPAPSWLRFLYLAGIVGGLALAALSALTGGGERPLPPGAVARVNDTPILRADLVRALKAVGAGKRQPLSEADKGQILQRLIEEELLVQRALSQNLAGSDPVLRSALVSAVTRDVIARSRARPVSPVLLRDYYYRNKARFARPARYDVRAVFFPAAKARERMAAFDAALAGGADMQALLRRFGQANAPVPAGLLPLQKLQDYLGSAPASALKSLRTGAWSPWIETKDGFWRFYVLNRTPARTPSLQSIKAQVEAAFRDDRDDAALRAYLNKLKRGAHIVLSEDAPR